VTNISKTTHGRSKIHNYKRKSGLDRGITYVHPVYTTSLVV